MAIDTLEIQVNQQLAEAERSLLYWQSLQKTMEEMDWELVERGICPVSRYHIERMAQEWASTVDYLKHIKEMLS